MFYRFIAVLTVGSFSIITFLSFSSFDNSSTTHQNTSNANTSMTLEQANAGSYNNVEGSFQDAEKVSDLNEADVNRIINEDLSKLGVPPLEISSDEINNEINQVEEMGKNKKVDNQ